MKFFGRNEDILKDNAHYTMPSQNLQIFIVVLVVNVMMTCIRSSSCFFVNVPGENKTFLNLFIYSPGPSLNEQTMISKIVDIAG